MDGAERSWGPWAADRLVVAQGLGHGNWRGLPAAMTAEIEEFWAALPPKALHPRRIPILEAFRCIGEPISAVMIVDVTEGEVTMWEAVAHLDALVRLGVMRRGERDPQAPDLRENRFDVLYSLTLGD